MKHWIGVLFCLLWVPEKSFAQHSDSVYLFSYFINNGEDGLHLAYSTDGYKWTAMNNGHPVLTPMVSQDKLMRDPCIIRGGDGRFHMVWTVSWKDKGIGYASSKDLVHWSPQQFIPVMAALPGARNTWAPEITYDPSTASYMIYWASTITGSFSETDSKLEDQYNHRLYYTTTNDFKAFTPTRLLYDPGFNCIDATILQEDGRFVMYLKDETPEPAQKNIRIAYSTAITGPYSKASAPITGRYWAEGPTVTTVGKTTIVYFDKYMENKYGAVATTDGKNWKDISERIQLPDGIRHGTILKITAAEFAGLNKSTHKK